VLEHDGDGRGGFEQRVAGEALVGHHSERINIGAAIERLAARLLGAHVIGRAHNGRARELGGGFKGFGDAKVGQEGLTAMIEENVARFDVAVDDVERVSVIERVGDGGEEARHFGKGQSAARHSIGERAAGHQRHDNVRHLVGRAEIVQRQDGRVSHFG